MLNPLRVWSLLLTCISSVGTSSHKLAAGPFDIADSNLLVESGFRLWSTMVRKYAWLSDNQMENKYLGVMCSSR